MLSTLGLILLSQTQPAVRRSTPLADDPGMVTRNIPSGTQNVNVVGGGPLVPGSPDGGLIGTVIAVGPDGGAVVVQGISGGGGGGSVTQGTVPWLVAGADGGAVVIQGSIAATNPSVSATGAAVPSSATLIAGSNAGTLTAPSVITVAPTTEPGLVTRNIPSGTQAVSGTVTTSPPANASTNVTQFGGNAIVTGTGTSGAGIPRVTVSSDSTVGVTGTVTVSGTVNAAQSGTWTVRNQDGVGNNLASSTTAPAGAEQALIVRNIPSGTQTVTGTVTTSGTVTANQGTPGTTANRWPIQVTDGTNLATVTVGGALRTDSSATTQPVSGTVTANAGTNLNTSALALETTLSTRLADSTFTGRINTLGQKVMAASTPIVIASDQSALNVTPAPLTDVTGAGTLNALNAVCSVTLTGRRGASFFVAGGTLAGTTVAEVSPDGTAWFPTLFVNQSTFGVLGASVTTNPNPAAMFTPYLPPGTVAARLRVSVFTAGSASCTSRASDNTPNLISPTTQVDGVVASTGLTNVVGATDQSDLPGPLRSATAPAAPSSSGLVTRVVRKSATAVASKNVSCGTSATSLTGGALGNRTSVAFYNNGTNTVFVGSSGVSTSNGFPLPPGAYFSDDISATSQEYFCVVAAGTEPVRVLEN